MGWPDLAQASGPLPLERFVPLMERLCEVVQAAHDQGIVHRDIKPSNVMVITQSGRLIPKLLDFGIAKVIELDARPVIPEPSASRDRAGDPDRGSETLTGPEPVMHRGDGGTGGRDSAATGSPGATSFHHVVAPEGQLAYFGLTREGQILGSPPYMAPEQWRNSSHVGPRTDQYALAMLAYEALSSTGPYNATTPAELAQCHLRAELPPLPPHIPAVVHTVLARAAAKEPEQRFDAVSDLATALRRAAGLADEPIDLPGELRAMWVTGAPRRPADHAGATRGALSLGALGRRGLGNDHRSRAAPRRAGCCTRASRCSLPPALRTSCHDCEVGNAPAAAVSIPGFPAGDVRLQTSR